MTLKTQDDGWFDCLSTCGIVLVAFFGWEFIPIFLYLTWCLVAIGIVVAWAFAGGYLIFLALQWIARITLTHWFKNRSLSEKESQ